MEQLRICSEEPKLIKTCAFTGHRKLEEDCAAEKLLEETEKMILRGAETFYNGMAMGFDLLAAETVLFLKKKYPYIRLVACVPCYGQERHFRAEDKQRYTEILKRANEQVVLSEHYYQGCMQVRDKYMADRADALIGYCKKDKGGAAYTVGYFRKKYPEKPYVSL